MIRWLARSVRRKLLAMALLPLLVVLPLLIAAVGLWGSQTYERLLITKVRSDLAVAHGYFDQVVAEVGGGTESVAQSHALYRALADRDRTRLQALLVRQREALGLDFLVFARPGEAAWEGQASGGRAAQLAVIDGERFAHWAPHLAERVRIPLVPTRNAAPTERSVETRALVVLAATPVRSDGGEVLGVLRGGVLLNQNLPFIDHINSIVYPEGSLPFGSKGTATLFMDDVRITTNVRLFQDQRAVGTRVSQAVSQAVMQQGLTWLDRAFVVSDWYVSAYEPLLDGEGKRVGMLYVGFLEEPFRWVMLAMLVGIALLFVAVMAAAAVLSMRIARGIFRPVEKMNRTIAQVEAGEVHARVGAVASSDEIGALAQHFDHLLGVVADKTEALQRWAAELDQRVAERTQELAASNASLRQAQRQLVQSEKLAAIGQLTASVAHEINNPIAVLQGNLDLLRDTLGDAAAPVTPELQLADQQIERMRRIVTQLLQHARPTEYAGYVETLDAGQVFDDCLVLVGPQLAQRGIAVAKAYGATATVSINRQELQQVLINLILNALQAMPGGGHLSLGTEDTEGGIALVVEDDGAGLPPGDADQLFRPFFTTRPEGHGLGLWISQNLMERYGGRIEAQRGAHGGAVFRVCLLAEGAQAPG